MIIGDNAAYRSTHSGSGPLEREKSRDLSFPFEDGHLHVRPNGGDAPREFWMKIRTGEIGVAVLQVDPCMDKTFAEFQAGNKINPHRFAPSKEFHAARGA